MPNRNASPGIKKLSIKKKASIAEPSIIKPVIEPKRITKEAPPVQRGSPKYADIQSQLNLKDIFKKEQIKKFNMKKVNAIEIDTEA